MSHHGHRHSRITRIINAKHQREADEEDIYEPKPKSYKVGTVQNQMVSPDPSSIEPCDPLQDTTCLENLTGLTKELLGKRQAESSAEAVQTIIQVEGSYSQTMWQATATESSMTLSDSISAQVTFSGSTATTDLLPATSPADFSTTSPVSSSSSTQTTTTSKPLVPVSSPRVSPAASSRHHSSTPLSSTTTPTTTATTSYATTSVYYSSSSPSTSYYWSDTAQSSSSATTFDGGALQTGTSTGSGTGGGSGSSTDNGSSGSSGISPTASKIVGGVVGSVAGLAVLFLLLFYILRQRGYLDRFFKGKGTQTLPSSDMGAGGSREMFERDNSASSFPASFFAPAFMKRWRQSSMTSRTDSTVDSGSSERGFQKISGRKIPPVLTHGGDGFGGGLDGDSPTIPDCLIGLSPASAGQGPLSPPAHRPPPTSPFGSPLDANYTREADEIPPARSARPSKVQLPVSNSVNFGTPTPVNPTFPLAQPQSAVPVLRDAIGRSHPSHDGSRGSRFTESLDM